MYQEINFSDFCDGFQGDRKDTFSYNGKRALYDYLIEYEESTGEEIEFDPIALCCEYSEYENIDEVIVHYENIKDIDDLRDNTQVIEFDGGIIIQNF